MAGEKQQTKVCPDNLSPVWNESFTFALVDAPAGEKVAFAACLSAFFLCQMSQINFASGPVAAFERIQLATTFQTCFEGFCGMHPIRTRTVDVVVRSTPTTSVVMEDRAETRNCS